MKKIYNAIWSESKKGSAIEFEISDVEKVGEYFIAVKGTTKHYKIDIDSEIEENEDHEAALKAILNFCNENKIEVLTAKNFRVK